MGKLVVMSHKEIHRLEIIQRVAQGRLYQSEAAEQLGISERQVRRLLRSYEGSGALGLVHKRRCLP